MKKRKISRNDPFVIHTRPPFHGAPNSQFHIATKEIDRKQKKVKFVAPEKDSCRLERDYVEREKFATCADDSKTSEFAFFKKLKEDVGRRLKKDASADYSEEMTNDVRVGSKGYNSSRTIQDVSTFKKDSFLSPTGRASNKADLYSNSSMQKNSQGCSDTFKPQGIFSHEGNQYVHGEIFSRKRQKLRQCVADALFPDTEKLCSKGHDIVSMLLNRLLPMSTVKNKHEDPNPGKVESSTKYELLDSRESDVQFKEHYQMPKRKLLELESGSYFNDQLLSPIFRESGERITPHAEFPTYHSHNVQPLYGITAPKCKLSGFPSFSASFKGDLTLDSRELDVQFTEHHQIPKRKLLELESSSYFSDHLLSPMFLRSVELITPHAKFPIYPHKFQPVFRTEAESKFGGTPSYVDNDKNDVTQGFLCNEQKHEIFTLNHFKELGKLEREPIPLLLDKDFDCTRDEQKHEIFTLNHFNELGKLEREPIPLLLDKYFDCTKDEIKLPMTCKYAKPYMAPELSILGHGEEQISNNTLGEYHFSPSSLLLDKPQDFNSVLDSGLLRCEEFRFGKYVYKDNEDRERNFNRTALSLSHNRHCFKFSENYKKDTSCVQDSIYLSPYHLKDWVRKTVSSDYRRHLDKEAWLPSSLDECQGLLSLTSSSSNYQSTNSRILHLPQRESVSSHFPIDDNYMQEIDGGNNGEMLYHFSEGLIEIYNSSFLHMSMQRDNGCPFSLDD